MHLAPRVLVLSAVYLLSGCPSSSHDGGGARTTPAGGTGGKANAAGNSAAGRAAGGSGAAAGGGGNSCPGNVAIPALCRVCANGDCGVPHCTLGTFDGFVCPDAAAGSGGSAGKASAAGSGGSMEAPGACNLACVKGKHCVLQEVQCIRAPCPPVPTCADDADAGTGTSLHWVESCGTPVCQAGPGNFDHPSIPNCTTQKEGEACSTAGDRCDGVFGCGATLLCAEAAPTNCPKSLARFKQDINYLGDAERARFHEQITQLRLAEYRYKTAPDVPQLGFMIDDVASSVAVAGEKVNLYGYLSMAVAAIQVQDQQIKALERELEQLRAQAEPNSSQVLCSP